MAGDLLSRVGMPLTELPDMKSLEADLLTFLFSLRCVVLHRIIRRVVVDLHRDRPRAGAVSE
jgi:hypothetical protein